MIELFHIILKKVHQKGPLRKIKWITTLYHCQQILNIHGQLPLIHEELLKLVKVCAWKVPFAWK